MPGGPPLVLDFSNATDKAVGPAHGLTEGDLRRVEPLARQAVETIEAERKSGRRRYRDLPADRSLTPTVMAAVKRHAPGCENLVVLGIGGSALGNIALQTALSHPYYNLLPATRRRAPRLFVMDNVDPVQFAGLLDLIGPALRRTCFNVISKSGETAETAAQFLIIRDLLAARLGERRYARRLIVTTDPAAGTMRELVDREGYDALPVPEGVGGRFSVLSAVGLFSAAMCGVNIRLLLAGAADMGRRVGEARVRKNPAAMLALILCHFYAAGKRLHVMMPYSYQLRDFADWYRQLWAESLGKAADLAGRPVGIGPTPIRALGATDQHSQVQLYREGPNDKVFMFLEVERFDREVKIPRCAGVGEAMGYLGGSSLGRLLNAEKRATEYALVVSQRPCLTIRFPRVSPHAVGQFIMLWEAATSVAGLLLGVNAYDQPAVQLGKECTFALMGRGGYESLRHDIESRGTSGRGCIV